MKKYNVTIGMEIHVELKTHSKMFSGAPNMLGAEESPNISVDPLTNAEPGTLPVPNKKAIAYVQKAGLALDCTIATNSKFDRKNYFYPDLPKGYQISQYDQPLCENGYVFVDGVKIGITRIHMEEDTGKNTHPKNATHSLVDLNRAGLPLMELVSEPDIISGVQARAFCQKLQRIFRYLEISDADIEKGQMRCEVNISLYPDGADPLSGTKVEIKNIGSLRSVEKAADYEYIRQSEILDEGGSLRQETRGWDDKANKTVAQRSKENANDYRYFPEPDIPPMVFAPEYIEKLRQSLPELPDAKLIRFKEQYTLRDENLDVIIGDKYLAEYFERTVSEIRAKKKSKELVGEVEKAVHTAANYLVNEVQKHLANAHQKITQLKFTAENYAELIVLTVDGTINSSGTQIVLEEMFQNGGDPSHIIAEKNLAQENDVEALNKIVDGVIANNQASIDDYKAGKENAIKYIMGQVMTASKGKANPQSVMTILREKLDH